ncbi:hypothetical protein ACTXT7_006119 [Hymenolepis weldensis]
MEYSKSSPVHWQFEPPLSLIRIHGFIEYRFSALLSGNEAIRLLRVWATPATNHTPPIEYNGNYLDLSLIDVYKSRLT